MTKWCAAKKDLTEYIMKSNPLFGCSRGRIKKYTRNLNLAKKTKPRRKRSKKRKIVKNKIKRKKILRNKVKRKPHPKQNVRRPPIPEKETLFTNNTLETCSNLKIKPSSTSVTETFELLDSKKLFAKLNPGRLYPSIFNQDNIKTKTN